jgi:thymidylate synthase ThyX
MSESKRPRVLAIAPIAPEKCAYALARYSRSADSIRQSLEWVRTHDSQKFLESFYFQYGHASIADLGHLALCFEDISELAATEIEDEQLWDGQAKSTRYQDFSNVGVVDPPELTGTALTDYRNGAKRLIEGYLEVHASVLAHLQEQLPRPEEMSEKAYHRNLKARAFDVARYLLFWGIPTNIGQVTSIRTLERQVRRMKASPYAELRSIGEETGVALAEPAACSLEGSADTEPIAPTLAKYLNADEYETQRRKDLRQWATQNLPKHRPQFEDHVDLLKPAESVADIATTLLFPETNYPFRQLYEMVSSWSEARQREVIDVALQSRKRYDEMPRGFRNSPYVFDIVMDIGAYRDMHRHRRCQQLRQDYSAELGYESPEALAPAGCSETYQAHMGEALELFGKLPAPGREYILPFATRSRFLFRMDFAEAEYISRLRSGVKGHFSYRLIAWKMREQMQRLEPALGALIDATHPSEEDPLTR